MPRQSNRFRAERSNLPAGAVCTHHVFDTYTGLVARRKDGRLAYFPTRREARDWAAQANDARRPIY